MTNYINSITLEDGSTYNIGPFKIDDSSNIVYHDYSAPSSVSSNVIIGSPVLPNSSIHNNIIIGNPSIEGSVSDTIFIGNSNFTIKVTDTSATISNILGISGAVSAGTVHAGPLMIGYQIVSSPCVVYNDIGPATLYAVGMASFADGTVTTVCGGVYVYPSTDGTASLHATYQSFNNVHQAYCYNIFSGDNPVYLGFLRMNSHSVSFVCNYHDPYAALDPDLVSCDITIYIQACIPSMFFDNFL